ncbi:CHAD domain-containing protein [Dyella jejuensis]|uniref:CHAD domain-containing protein n=1 Tax=Dyella jejuensis TaxID=1432009 RepID=A0ABW8JJG3_9GAMM
MTQRNIGTAFSELSQKECRAVRRALERCKDRHKAIHEARKAVRRLRSILSLTRGDLGDQAEPIDKALKRFGDGLSSLRDATAVIASAKYMAKKKKNGVWPELVARLETERDSLLEAALQKDPDFQKRQKRIDRLSHAIEQLPWAKIRKKSVDAVLKKSGKRVEKAQRKFEQAPRPARLHSWRRRVRRQRMQLQTWHKVANHAGHDLHHRIRTLSRLSDALGWRQDLQVLRSHVRHSAEGDELSQLMSDIREAMQHASL